MKKITKVLGMTLVIMFMAIPILQQLTGKGVVYAEDRPRTFYIHCNSEKEIQRTIDKNVNRNKEDVVINTIEYQYKLQFKTSDEVKQIFLDIEKKDLDKVSIATVVSAKCTTPGYVDGTFNLYLSGGKEHKKVNGKYDVTRDVHSIVMLSNWGGKKSESERIIALGKINLSNNRIVSVAAELRYCCLNEVRVQITVSPKKTLNVKNDNYLKNIYDEPVENQTTYINSNYNYNNSTDNYAVDNVSSTINQTITPKSSTIYANVNINDDGRRLFIRHLYRSVQKREPASEDYVNYMKRNVQTNAIDVIMSKEANEKNNINGMSNEEFVKLIYRAILCRDPDATGLADYTRLLNNGVPKTAVIKEIVESVEFRERWNKTVKTLTFDQNMCTAVYDYLRNVGGVHIIKSSNTTIKMFADGVNDVKELNISSKNLKNLNGLSQFPNLEILTAMYNQYTDISEVSKLSNVKKLDLSNSKLSSIDISPIKSMKKLEELHLDNNGLTNKTLKISGITSLKKLYLNNNSITSISEGILTNNLTELYMNNNEVMDTEEVDYSNVKTISLKNNKNGLYTSGTTKFIPQIIDNARNSNSKLYSPQGLTFNKCKIVGKNLVMDSNVAVATVTIKSGPAAGTVITLKNLDVAQ